MGARALVVVAASLALALVPSCAYPRRSTSLTAVAGPAGGPGEPADTYALTIVEAQVPQRGRGNRDWDDGHGLPDPFVRVYRDDVLVFESRTMSDTLHPVWNQTLPRNLTITPDASIRIEMWDADAVGADPIGVYRGHGRPSNAIEGGEARLMLEGDATLTIRLDDPRAQRGVGIGSFEVRGGELYVVNVEPHSPAGRAGVASGDRIVGIGGQSVSSLGADAATSALSMASERHQALSLISSGHDQPHDVQLDTGYVWLVM
jgi:hypothetical protein